MDLPTCPSCGQSVLDDDVDDCPFCGASLSGKPAAKPKQPAAAESSSAAPETEAKSASTATKTKPKSKAAPAKSTATKQAPSEDDPFALERATAARRKVVQLKPRPQPGRKHEVVCPMCETIGYTARKAAGMDVKCANPNCEFPLFTAPAVESEEEAEAAAEAQAAKDTSWKRFLTPVNVGIGVFVLLALIIVAMYLPGSGSNSTPGPDGPDPVTDNTKKGDKPIEENGPNVVGPRKNEKTDAEKIAELRQEVLLRISRQSINDLLPKAIARHLTVIAFARAGKTKEAEDALTQLRTVAQGSGGEFFLIRPLATLAQAHRKAGDEKTANERLDEAKTILAGLKKDVGRSRYDAMTTVAAWLTAAGKLNDAKELLNADQSSDAVAQESLILFAARTVERDNVGAAIANRPVRHTASAAAVSVTLLLAAHDHMADALKWAQAQSTDSRPACLTAWAEARIALAEKPQAAELKAAIDPVGNELSGVLRAAFHARLARRYHAADLKEAAQSEWKAAQSLLANVKTPAQPKPPGIKQVPDYRPTSDSAWQAAETLAAACYELAHTEFVLGHNDEGKKSLSKAQDVLRSLSHSPAMVKKLEGTGRGAIAAAFQLVNAGAINARVREFRRAVQLMEKDTNRRFALQTRQLEYALNWNLPDALPGVWDIVKSSSDSTAAEPWQSSRVPYILWAQSDLAGNTQLKATVSKWMKRDPTDRQLRFWNDVMSRIRGRNYHEAGEQFGRRHVDDSWRRLFALTVASRLFNKGAFEAAYDFCQGLNRDPALQMEAFDFFAARTVRKHGPLTAWDKLKDKLRRPSESAAMCYGFLRALPPPEPKKKPAKKEAVAKQR